MNIAISTTNLTRRFRRTAGYADLLPFRKRQWVTAVENLSLDIKEGEFFGLLGPNGAGKTTLIKMLCCLVMPSAGKASIFGHDTVKEEQAVKQLIGLVSAEERSFYWRLTGRENLQFYASLYNLSGQRANKRIDYLLSLMDLKDKADIRFQNYSTGMRQKLAIARGLLSEPQVLFVDEPTRSLDPVSAQNVRRFLKETVAASGKTIILATHNLHEAEQLCDRLAIINHGHMISLGSVTELRSIFQTQEKCELQVKHLDNAMISRLSNINGILDCHVTNTQNSYLNLELIMSNRSVALPQVLETMVNSGVEICNCQLKELALEEIFTHALKSADTSKEVI